MKRSIFFILVMLIAVCVGCITRETADSREAKSIWADTELWVEYIALPDYGAFSQTRPLPLYPDWNAERMKNDIAQMRSVNINGVLLRFTPQELLNEVLWQQLRNFSQYAHQRKLSVMLYLDSEQPLRLTCNNLLQWLNKKGYGELEAVWQDDLGKPAVLLSERIDCTGEPFASSTIRILRVGVDFPAECATAEPGALSVLNAICWCRARAGAPRLLRQQIQHAMQFEPKRIIISSWNDWARGTFIQPDSANRNAFCKMLLAL
jgi:hypothetical protein